MAGETSHPVIPAVATSTAMASLWLLPKVAEFQRDNEEIDLRIIAYDHVKDYAAWIAIWRCITAVRRRRAFR